MGNYFMAVANNENNFELKWKGFTDGFMIWWTKLKSANRYFVHVRLDDDEILMKEVDRNTSYFILSPLPSLKFDVYVEAENAEGKIFAKSTISTIEISNTRSAKVLGSVYVYR